MKTNEPTTGISDLLLSISPQPRLEILLMIGADEACVCHLEARLGYRQAYISQHLMAMRQAGLLHSRRDGKYVFYRLSKPEILSLIQQAARISGVNLATVEAAHSATNCGCPHCSREVVHPSTAGGPNA